MKFALTAILVFLVPAWTLAAAQRVPWTTSRVVGSPEPPPPYHVERVYPRLSFKQPVELLPLAGTGRMILLEVSGKLYTFEDQPDCGQADLAIDLRPRMDGFQQALGLAIHPNFADNRQIFVVYAGGPITTPDGSRLSRFTMTQDSPPRIDPASEEILLTWPSGGHNGCAIRFDSQGLLYFSTGDGAGPFPPDEYSVGQDLSDLRSTICRIDVDRREPGRRYAIPPDNPFQETAGARPEIWAYGFRNPWRFDIDRETDRLWCGDVGWELWELIFDVRRGGNYGWSIYEGPQPIRGDLQPGPTPILKPLVAYSHAVGQSVTGGIVYRGNQHALLRGAFLYGDFVTGLLWGVRSEGDRVTWNEVLAETGLQIITFAASADGESVLVMDYGGGIYRLVPNESAAQPSRFPRRLSETGLFASTPRLEPAAGVLPYRLSAEAWQDGASSQYVVGVPGTETIRIDREQRSWAYPAGTVFARTLFLDSRRIETQLLHFNGIDWQPYSYRWNEEQSDAELVDASGLAIALPAGGRVDGVATHTWQIPNRAQCRACHSRQNGGAVGFTLENLDRDQQIERFVEIGILDRAAPPTWNMQPMVNPADQSADLQQRARSYLAANCAHCHRRGAGGTVPMDLSYLAPPDEVHAIGVPPMQGKFGMEDAKVVAPGDPYRSVLFYRLATSGTGHMPKPWTRDNDVAGLRLIHDWIQSLGTSPAGDRGPLEPATALASTSDSLRLFARLLEADSNSLDPVAVATLATAHDNPVTAALFERFLPAQLRPQRLGNEIDVQAVLARRGDAQRGRQWFFAGQAGQCIECHRLQGSGKSVGPDLDGIASRRTRAQLLESILDPPRVIEPLYQTYVALLDDGTVVTGLKVSEDVATVVIRSAEGKDIRMLKLDLDTLQAQPQSLMPSGMAAEMTAQELANLLEFLESLN
jgi:putative heme-binding domain-containing protein